MVTFLKERIAGLDIISWIGVLLFFALSALLFHGQVFETLWGAVGIVVLMVIISISISVILDHMQNHPRAGEVAGYITNGPEALCVLVGLINHKLMFATSVPIGSNFVNPLLLILAVLVTRRVSLLFKEKSFMSGLFLLATAATAGSFYLVDKAPAVLWLWCGVALGFSILFYRLKQSEAMPQTEDVPNTRVFHAVLAVVCLVAAGYYLDPVVSYTAALSKLPEGVIGFVVLSFMSSWPEFRSSVSLLEMGRASSAFVNILVSNITNLWLVIVGVVAYLLMG